MATFSISGNVGTGTSGVNVYIQAPQTGQVQPSPSVTQTDVNGNWSFSGLLNAVVYQVKTALSPPLQVTINGGNISNLNFPK